MYPHFASVVSSPSGFSSEPKSLLRNTRSTSDTELRCSAQTDHMCIQHKHQSSLDALVGTPCHTMRGTEATERQRARSNRRGKRRATQITQRAVNQDGPKKTSSQRCSRPCWLLVCVVCMCVCFLWFCGSPSERSRSAIPKTFQCQRAASVDSTQEC